MKKRFIYIVLISLLVLGCTKKINVKNVDKEANFIGFVSEVNDQSILVKINEDEDEFKSSDIISVTLKAELEESETDFQVGDKVHIYYDGNIQESYPAQLGKVYMIKLLEA